MFTAVFAVAVVLTAVLTYAAQRPDPTVAVTSSAFSEFKRIYLCVYFLAVASDWLQGPYVYALYSAYGFSQSDIAELFVAGFGSSFLFGTFVGALADQHGRKKWALLYAITYSLSCVTKHFRSYGILMVGRLLGGVATSLLFSVFESWMASEHISRGFPTEWMGKTLSLAMLGNSIVAIVAGIVAQQAAELYPLLPISEESSLYFGGYCAPFDIAILCLVLVALVVSRTWHENYGSGDSGHALSATALKSGLRVILANRNVWMIGAIQSLFEGSMYTFVFMWTPAMTTPGETPPHGLIFATFMVCCMMGASTFGLVSSKVTCRNLLWRPLLVSAIALAVPAFTDNKFLIYIAFLTFEVCVGIYFPCIGTIKGEIIPEDSRSAVYNLFRVPLNVIVVTVLLTNLSVQTSMLCCSGMLTTATVLALSVQRSVRVGAFSSVRDMGEDGSRGWLGNESGDENPL